MGLYGQWKKFTTPPHYVKNHHFLRSENMKYILTVRMSSSTINQYHRAFWEPMRLFKLSKWAKTYFTVNAPLHPYRGRRFLADSVSFFNQFFWKRCQIDQEHILHQIRLSPKVFETSPFFIPSIVHHHYFKTAIAKVERLCYLCHFSIQLLVAVSWFCYWCTRFAFVSTNTEVQSC